MIQRYESALESVADLWSDRYSKLASITTNESLDWFESSAGIGLPSVYREAALRWAGMGWVIPMDSADHVLHGVSTYGELLSVPSGVVGQMATFVEWQVVGDPAEFEHAGTIPLWGNMIPIIFGEQQLVLCLDFRFDSADPPVIQVDMEAYESPESALSYIADSFLSFLEMAGGIETQKPDGLRRSGWEDHVKNWIPVPPSLAATELYYAMHRHGPFG